MINFFTGSIYNWEEILPCSKICKHYFIIHYGLHRIQFKTYQTQWINYKTYGKLSSACRIEQTDQYPKTIEMQICYQTQTW
jgi:hypothetical protein